MMKLYADLTELNERDVSAKSLKRLRWVTYLSLPFIPLLGIMDPHLFFFRAFFNPLLTIPLTIIFLVSAVALIVTAFSKLPNRVWVRDKYLDEWELAMKHRSLAFALQVLMWSIAALVTAGVLLDMFSLLSLPEITPLGIGYGLFSLLMVAFYVQVFVQIGMVEPVEADELDPESGARRPINGIFVATGLLIAAFVIAPATVELVSDMKGGMEISKLSAEAKRTCEARGSRVHWVSVAEDNYGFGCFDENRPSPIDTKTE